MTKFIVTMFDKFDDGNVQPGIKPTIFSTYEKASAWVRENAEDLREYLNLGEECLNPNGDEFYMMTGNNCYRQWNIWELGEEE